MTKPRKGLRHVVDRDRQISQRLSTTLSPDLQTDLRDLWWRLVTQHGVPLPAEPGVILLAGSSS